MIRTAVIPDTGRARACATDPALFASTDILDHTLAARHCDVCPVRVACREVSDQRAVEDPASIVGTHGGGLFHGASS